MFDRGRSESHERCEVDDSSSFVHAVKMPRGWTQEKVPCWDEEGPPNSHGERGRHVSNKAR